MKNTLLFPIVVSLLLGIFMITPAYGFVSFITAILEQLDYTMIWSVTPMEVALIAIIPWIAYRLLETPEKRSVKNQLGLTIIFLVSALIFFTFGFLLLELGPDQNQNPLFPAFVKIQPFHLYWGIWFVLSEVLVVVFYLINRKQTEAERHQKKG